MAKSVFLSEVFFRLGEPWTCPPSWYTPQCSLNTHALSLSLSLSLALFLLSLYRHKQANQKARIASAHSCCSPSLSLFLSLSLSLSPSKSGPPPLLSEKTHTHAHTHTHTHSLPHSLTHSPNPPEKALLNPHTVCQHGERLFFPGRLFVYPPHKYLQGDGECRTRR